MRRQQREGTTNVPSRVPRPPPSEALTTPALLSQRERREKNGETTGQGFSWLCSPLSPRERGVRGVRASEGTPPINSKPVETGHRDVCDVVNGLGRLLTYSSGSLSGVQGEQPRWQLTFA